MRKFLLSTFLVAAGSAAALAPSVSANDAPKAPEQPRTMNEVIARVVDNENHLYGRCGNIPHSWKLTFRT